MSSREMRCHSGSQPVWRKSSSDNFKTSPSHLMVSRESNLPLLGEMLYHNTVFSLSCELGSGEFGVVRRGVWSVGGEEREVAVKSLADGSTEEKRIQFLQEAAIMGQFKHPNVITLHGVLLESKQVS